MVSVFVAPGWSRSSRRSQTRVTVDPWSGRSTLSSSDQFSARSFRSAPSPASSLPILVSTCRIHPDSRSVSLPLSHSPHHGIYPFSPPNSHHITTKAANMSPRIRRSEKKQRDKKEKDGRTKAEKEAEEADQRAERKRTDLEATVIIPRNGGHSGHHCLWKDAASTHALRQKCFENGHMGVCPYCKWAASFKHGCRDCGVSGRGLLTLKESEERVKKHLGQLTEEETDDLHQRGVFQEHRIPK